MRRQGHFHFRNGCDDRLGLLFVEEVAGPGHGVHRKRAQRALEETDLVVPHVAVMRRRADQQAHGAADLPQMRLQLVSLARAP